MPETRVFPEEGLLVYARRNCGEILHRQPFMHSNGYSGYLDRLSNNFVSRSESIALTDQIRLDWVTVGFHLTFGEHKELLDAEISGYDAWLKRDEHQLNMFPGLAPMRWSFLEQWHDLCRDLADLKFTKIRAAITTTITGTGTKAYVRITYVNTNNVLNCLHETLDVNLDGRNRERLFNGMQQRVRILQKKLTPRHKKA